MEGARVVHERESKWRLAGLAERARISDFTGLHRVCKENYRALYTNARNIPYLRTLIFVFFRYKKIRAAWSKSRIIVYK